MTAAHLAMAWIALLTDAASQPSVGSETPRLSQIGLRWHHRSGLRRRQGGLRPALRRLMGERAADS